MRPQINAPILFLIISALTAFLILLYIMIQPLLKPRRLKAMLHYEIRDVLNSQNAKTLAN